MQATMKLEKKLKMSMPARLLRLEGLAVLVGSVALYAWLDYSWLWFAVLFFLPDMALFVYLANKQTGKTVYNLVHTITLPLILAVIGLLTGSTMMIQLGLIWLAHIGLDRTIGYGIKYDGELKETHLQRV